MKAWGKIELGSVATISTAHIPQDDLELLEAVLDKKSKIIEDREHWIHRLQWSTFDYGFMLGGWGIKNMLEEYRASMPQFLVEAAELARDLNLTWIVYDSDGITVDGMTDWHEESEQ